MTEPDWAGLERDVVERIRILRAAWQATASNEPELHPQLVKDLYLPVVRILAEFVAAVMVRVEEEIGPLSDPG